MPNVDVQRDQVVAPPLRWRELWLKEDWWAIWLGIGIVVVAYVFFANGANIRWIAVTPSKWSTLPQLGAHFAGNYERYIVQFLAWLAVFTVALTSLGHKARDFLPSFAILYALSVAIFALGQWDQANTYNLEPPLVALAVGLVLSNLIGLPRFLDAGFRVEFYIKTGIVLLGATLPFTAIVWAGPAAILQASIVSIVTFLVIYWVAIKRARVIREVLFCRTVLVLKPQRPFSHGLQEFRNKTRAMKKRGLSGAKIRCTVAARWGESPALTFPTPQASA
jgi:hypothetical protein